MTKNRKLSITTLALTSVASLVSAAAIMGGTLAANAERDITLTGSNYFYTASDAEIGEYQDGSSYYTSFIFADDDSAITYRKNLAYHWFSSVKDDDGNPTTEAEEGYLSTEIGFDGLNFETFTIKFQSQQYTGTDDGVTDNYITFVASDDSVYVKIGDVLYGDNADEDEIAEAIAEVKEEGTALSYDRITISFTGYNSGVYSVEVTDGENTQEGEFTNVGGSFASYVSSNSATSVIPLTYSAQFAEGSQESATMILYSFNGQSFELFGDEDGSRTITDDTPPVICLSEDLTYLEYGREVDIDYTVIDMLATSPRATLNYYVLTEDQLAAGDLNNTDDDGNFVSISSSSVSPVIRSKGSYVPEDDEYDTECLVKVYYSIQDVTGTTGNSDVVFIEWYVPSEYLYTVEGGDGNEYSFIRAVNDGIGATYVNADSVSDYQQLVEEELASQEASAGEGNYFYLPSFEEYISDNLTLYRDLEFTIYYNSSASGSVSSLAYNELSLELAADGVYRFAIYATDAAGNDMYYIDEDGEMVTFTGDDVADLLSDPGSSDLDGIVPVFEFSVSYGGLSVTDPEGQEIGYVGTEYTASGFEISGLLSNYDASYELYLFNRQAYMEATGESISYSELISLVSELFNDAESRSAYFTQIFAPDELLESDERYEENAEYEWDSSSLSFIPQDDNAFYVIRLAASDKTYITPEIESFMVISVSAAADHIYGEDTWLQDNIASVVLLCVAGLALIGIILLIVIKPKDKGDIDLIEDKPAKRVSSRKKAKNNA